MKKYTYFAIKLLISFIIAGSTIFAGTSLLRFMDPTFSVGLFDLLSQLNPTAWLLLGLLAGLIFAGLSKLPAFSSGEESADASEHSNDEVSD